MFLVQPEVIIMGVEGAKDQLKNAESKSTATSSGSRGEIGQPTVDKRFPKITQIANRYFPRRRSLPAFISFYGPFIVAGFCAGVYLELALTR
ncbi:hypothetical protein RND81_02G133300 [Saponaria officinalis]|uniref:Uncharacterized protein n=1 Tax=Saponaria officinalis TaxID=3572 RepID=A0AAW1MTT8_SAPOF